MARFYGISPNFFYLKARGFNHSYKGHEGSRQFRAYQKDWLRMKILQINNHYDYYGGANIVFINTGKLLDEYGHEVTYFAVRENNESNKKCSHYILWPEKRTITRFIDYFYNSNSKARLEFFINKYQPQVAHLHIFYGGLSNSIFDVLKKYNIPTVMTVHDYRLLCPAHNFIDRHGTVCEICAERGYISCIKKKCLRNSVLISTLASAECMYRDLYYPYDEYVNHFIFLSRFSYDKYIQYKPGLKNKASVLYNFSPTAKTTCESAAIKKNSIVYIGRLSREKGILNLVNLWQTIDKSIRLVIAGSGPQEKEIKYLVRNNALNNVEVLGQIDRNDVGYLLRTSKYLILPSICYEHNPLSVLEAYAAGIPVIVSRLGAMTELVPDGTGFLFDPFDNTSIVNAIRQASEISEIEYMKIRKAVWRHYRMNYSKEVHVKRLIEIYESVIKSTDKSPNAPIVLSY